MSERPRAPYLERGLATLYQGDVLEVLREMDSESVHCVVTSPPYWGLRDYGTASWEGGDPGCDHKSGRFERGGLNGKQASNRGSGGDEATHTCGKCGAHRVDQQIGLEPTPEAHFATFPEALVEPCIKAGTSERGVCPECGAPWKRSTSVEQVILSGNKGRATQVPGAQNWVGVTACTRKNVTTLGWAPTCTHDAEPVPAVCLDPFAGSGTVPLVAQRLGRQGVGIELAPDYCEIAARRLAQEVMAW